MFDILARFHALEAAIRVGEGFSGFEREDALIRLSMLRRDLGPTLARMAKPPIATDETAAQAQAQNGSDSGGYLPVQRAMGA